MCGFTRPATTIASARAACASQKTVTPLGVVSDFDDLHLAFDRRADGRLGHAQTGEHRALTGARAAAMRPHRGDEKRFAADVANRLRQAAQELGKVGDSAAAGGDRDARAALDPAAQGVRERVVRRMLRIGDRRRDQRVADDTRLDDVHPVSLQECPTCMVAAQSLAGAPA